MRFSQYLIMILFYILATLAGKSQKLPAVCSGDISTYTVDGLPRSVFIWEVDNDSIEVINSGDTAEINWDITSGVYRVSVREITEYGCEGAPVFAYVNVGSSTVDIGDDIELCEGETYTFNPGTYDYYTWQNGSTSPTFTASETGTVWVEVKNESGCKGWDTAQIVVHERPVVELGNDTAICGTNSAELDAGAFDFYNWSTGESTRWITAYSGLQTISVEVTDFNGCTAKDSIKILACSATEVLGEIPNVFTPNGDGNHDTWEVPYIQLFPEAKVEVFDRWGRLVFVSENGYRNDWDGTSTDGKELPMDSYHYVINFNDGSSAPAVGNVTIIR